MKESLYSLISLGLGIYFASSWEVSTKLNFGYQILLCMLVLIGVNLGMDQDIWAKLSKPSPKMLILPIGTLVGTVLGVILLWYFAPIYNLKEYFLVGSALGYYSLASSMMSGVVSKELVLAVFFTNLFRELLVMIFAGPISRIFGNLALINISASASDSCLPVISQYTDQKDSFVALLHGVVLSSLVPIFISLLIN